MNLGIVFAVIAIAGIAAGVYFIFFKKKSASSTTSGTVLPSGWSITNSVGMPQQMTPASDGSYFFDFPSQGQGSVHYVVKPAGSLQVGQLVTMQFNVSGSGTVTPVQGTTAQVSLFMQRAGDNLSGAGAYQQYRYWHSAVPLVNGDGSISAALNPDQWTDVFGESGSAHETGFRDCVAQAEMIGMTFGDPGAGAAGHGCYVSNGNARFTLKSFTVQ